MQCVACVLVCVHACVLVLDEIVIEKGRLKKNRGHLCNTSTPTLLLWFLMMVVIILKIQ